MKKIFINKYKFLRNILLICLLGNIVYFIFPFPPIFWRVIYTFIVLYISLMLLLSKKMRLFESTIIIFVGLNLIYFFISYMWLEPSLTQIGNILFAMLSFPAFIFLGRKGLLSNKFMFITMILVTIFSIPAYYYTEKIALENLMYGEVTTINASTFFLMILPLCIVNYKKIVTIFIYFVCLYFILMSAKRGNIISVIIPSIIYAYLLLKNSKSSILKNLLYFAAMLILGYYIYDLVSNNEYLIKRFNQILEGDFSGRDNIYSRIWRIWYDSDNIINLLFGYGFDGSIKSIGARAHNDWLEILICNGLFGVFIYFSIFYALLLNFFKEKDLYLRSILISGGSIWILKTMFSMGYSEPFLAILAMTFGYYFSKLNFTYNK